MRKSSLARLSFLAILVFSAPIAAEDWLEWGGPKGDFTVDVEGLAEGWPEGGPKTLWKRELGGGYSSILSKGDTLYTMFRADEEEVFVALDARTGATKWEHRYKVTFWPDMRMAFGDGPNATPLIVGDRIFGISIDGQLRSLDLATGKLAWKHDLPAEYGRRARDEEYGYSASPMQYQGKVIVLVGGDDHAVVAFDPVDGSTVWASEAGGVSYAATTVTTLGGVDQFVYFSPLGVIGLDPTTGRTLWFHEMEYTNGNHLTPIVKCDESHIWVGSQFPTGGGRLLEITEKDGKWKTHQVWFETHLRASHWTMIRLGDLIYGSIGGNRMSILAGFDWKTGEVVWRQRGFHKAQALYADEKLLFLDEDGRLALGRISPDGFELLASAEVTESISWSLPTLVGTTLYLRDNTNILALDLSVGGKSASGAADLSEPAALLGAFGEFVRQLESADEKQQMLDEYMAAQDSFPVVEGDSLVHFVYRGDAPDVAIQGNFLDRGAVEPLHLVEGTDFYFRSYELPAAALFEYQFAVFDDRLADPLNSRRLTSSDDLPCVVTTGGWSEAAHLGEPSGDRGRLDSFNWTSEILENEREIKVYLPAGYEASTGRYPLVLVNYGNQALEAGRWGNSLDNLIGESVAPLIAVFIPRADFGDYGPRVARFADALQQELIPYLDSHYRTIPEAEARAITGIASGGFASAYLALGRPGSIGNVALQSFYYRSEAEQELRAMIDEKAAATTRFYIEWSTHDFVAGDDLQCEANSRELAALLTAGGYAVVTSEVNDGAGWGNWRTRTNRILETFFPLEE